MSAKDAYVEKMEAQIKQLGAKFTGLKEKAKEKIADGKIKMEEGKEEGKVQYDAFVAKFDEFKRSGEDKWEAAKESIEKAWGDLTKKSPKPNQPISQSSHA